jgi:hypothetical protein
MYRMINLDTFSFTSRQLRTLGYMATYTTFCGSSQSTIIRPIWAIGNIG